MSDANFATLIDFAAGGLMLAAVLIVWRRDLRSVVKLLAWCVLEAGSGLRVEVPSR